MPGSVDHADYRPGAIKKLELTNFMTHTYVELRPSSAVNFVLGANGSGKSSLVCALCLGLGGDVRDMERGKELKAYIMTGKTEATIKVRGERPARARGAAGRPAPRRCALSRRRACPAAPAATAAPLLARARRAQTLLTGRPGDGGDWEVVRTLKTSGGNSWRINNTEVAHDGVSTVHATSHRLLSSPHCSRAHLHSLPCSLASRARPPPCARADALRFLREEMSIQMDNKCMFLPQERVSFARLRSRSPPPPPSNRHLRLPVPIQPSRPSPRWAPFPRCRRRSCSR